LALAQSRLVAEALGRAEPGIEVELVPVTTRGDRELSTPLDQVNDPDFFSAELDDALLDGRVDCCVHSRKDLPAARPPGITLAALPPRENPRDVLVWRDDVQERLADGQRLSVGTCSERRRVNVRDFLAWALPRTARRPTLEFVDVRGPIDTRLKRLQLPLDAPEAVDGIVLALAGLSRLYNDPPGRARLEALLAGTRLMVLPLAHCPAAPAQGVLAIECRADDIAARRLLGVLHDPRTAELDALENAALAELPPGQRGTYGATAVRHETLGTVCFVRGRLQDSPHAVLKWRAPARPARAVPFDGLIWQRVCTRRALATLPELARLPPRSPVFVAYWHAVDGHPLPPDPRLWVSGAESWRQLAARGLWVEGCGDNLGVADLASTLACPVLRLPPLADWTALTHVAAVPGWADSGFGRVLATYEILAPTDSTVLAQLAAEASRATHFYWSSPEQFLGLRHVLRTDAQHACGAGKTLRALRAAGVEPVPFPNGREWHRWLG
jgi:hydroxymethylbilane synthase